MDTMQFKTNINCGGCLAKAKPFLDEVEGIEKWEVDLQSEDRILTVEACELSVEEIKDTLQKAGFSGEQVD
ncbi:MAG: heavy-metal-associated domain-containing protein [Lewinellaceae bacterium]|nr:heavy-metal-associated domain-containing protein [Phaeodactylibacter sp.]MCB9352374.1 heavy-metal-associated domain-containing protein [Lewinellaceae bacterium]